MSCKAVFHRMLSSLSIANSFDIMPDMEALTPTTTANKLSVIMAATFLAGEMAGSGVLALPKAITDSGWIGIFLILLCCVNTGYSGSKLAKCWIMIEERYPQYSEHVGSPYPAIGFRAFGTKMKYLVTFCVSATLFGVSTVLLLLIAQLLQGLLVSQITMSYCFWILIIGLILLPLTFFGTPKDFWPMAVFALSSIAIACILTFIQILFDEKNIQKEKAPAKITFETFVFAFGTILFAFGGAALFPTIQNDMQDRKQFPKSIVITFTILIFLYAPVAISGFFVYGSEVQPDIIQNLTPGAVTKVVRVLLIVHMFFAFIIALNPFSQQLEEVLKITQTTGLNWRRYLLRSCIVILVIFTALSVPHFGNILALIGGSTITMLTFIFPPLFYLKLCSQRHADWPVIVISLHEKAYLCELIFVGVLGGVASTWSAISSIVTSSTFTVPCYVNPNSECYVDPNANCQ